MRPLDGSSLSWNFCSDTFEVVSAGFMFGSLRYTTVYNLKDESPFRRIVVMWWCEADKVKVHSTRFFGIIRPFWLWIWLLFISILFRLIFDSANQFRASVWQHPLLLFFFSVLSFQLFITRLILARCRSFRLDPLSLALWHVGRLLYF